jgi:MSHA biogenesis protein MshO
MIMVISIMGIVGVLVSIMAGNQMDAYVAMSRRAALVASGGALITHLERDIRNAVPNSLRISGNVMELVPIVSSMRYREAHGSHATSNPLNFSAADDAFQVLGNISGLPTPARLVVFNSGLTSGGSPVAGMNLYGSSSSGGYPPLGAHVITPATTSLSLTDDPTGDIITLSSPHQFSFPSPHKRMYIVSGALTYRFDSALRQIVRHRGYPIQASQPTTAAQFNTLNATNALMASKVTACSFSYQAGTPQQSALITVKIKLEDAGEYIELLHQIHVDNAI